MLEKITPLILTWNEAPNIGRTLERLSWAHDIVVVDSFSNDGTLEIVSNFPQTRIFQRAFDSHDNQWNFGLRETGIASAWVMALDADYILPAELIDEINGLQPVSDAHGYCAPVVYCLAGHRLKSAIYPPPIFLYRREDAEYYLDGHTQRLRLRGRIETLRSAILHDDRKSQARWLSSQSRYQELESLKLVNTPAAELNFADRVRKLRIVAPAAVFLYCLIYRGGILEGWPGIFYAGQRMTAELLLSLCLIRKDIERRFMRASAQRDRRFEGKVNSPIDRDEPSAKVSLNFQTAFGEKSAKVLIPFWGIIALVSLIRGVINSLLPGQSQDFGMITKWLSVWLSGANPYYLPPQAVANYPPHAIVFLTPLALLPQSKAALIWSVVNLGLAVFAGVAAFKIFNAKAARTATILFCLMFLSWADLRVGFGVGQLSLLITCFGIGAVLMADRSSTASGILLGLSLMKPHLGIGFLLWFALTGRFKASAISLCVALLGVVVFAARLGTNPISVVTDFLSVLRFQFGGKNFAGGATELRPLLHALISNFGAAEMVNAVVIIGLLAGILVIALDSQNRRQKHFETTLLQLTCLWSLLAVFHNSYDLVLMVIVVAALCSGRFPRPFSESARFDLALFWFLQIALVVEINGLWWKLSKQVDLSGGFLSLPAHFNRILCAVAFLFVLHRIWGARMTQQHTLVTHNHFAGSKT